MGIRVKGVTTNANAALGAENSENLDSDQGQREATVDGYTFHFGINERKNFLDEGVGSRVALFHSNASIALTPVAPIEAGRF